MIQWSNISTTMPSMTLFTMPQIPYVSAPSIFPFGSMSANFPCTPVVAPTPQGISSFTNPFSGWFNFSFPTFSSFSFPTITMPKFLTDTWNNIRTTTSNIFNSAKRTVSTAVKAVGNFASRMIAGAKKYLGFNEKDGSYKKFTNGRTEAWCADFATYVARESGSSIPHFSSVSQILDWGQKNGRFSKTPKVGDLVIYKGVDKNGKRVSHTGIVTAVENGRIKTIEGNTSDKVSERSCSIQDSRITGFVSVA